MSSPLFHIDAGVTLSAIICLPHIIGRWRDGHPLARLLRRWCLLALFLGAWFAIPALAVKTGLIEGPPQHWLWNLFGFHPLLASLWPHTTILGIAMFTGLMALHYVVIVAAIIRAGRFRSDATLPAAKPRDRPAAGTIKVKHAP